MLSLGGAPAHAAAERVLRAGFALYYWIEIARNAAMADAHPEWMASLQGHTQWRRQFPQAPEPGAGEVIKCYPWVPVLYAAAFAAHLERVRAVLESLPEPRGIFLNDLQAAPSACGCGNVLCRWTADYGPVATAQRLPADAAARFLARVAELEPGVAVIPVWATECEAIDRDHECGGVGCFTGACWKEWTAQLAPVARASETIAVLLADRLLGRDDERHGGTAAVWIKDRLRAFATMPATHGGQPIAAARLLAILQGWDATETIIARRIEQTAAAGAQGFVLALAPLEQGFEPRLVKAR